MPFKADLDALYSSLPTLEMDPYIDEIAKIFVLLSIKYFDSS